MIKAAFFDVDGTLMSHQTRQVPPSTVAALKKLRERGVPCILATGRHVNEIDNLPVGSIPFDGYIMLNGQLILDDKRRVLHGVPFRGRALEHLVDLFNRKQIPLALVEEDGLRLNFVNERVVAVQDVISSKIPPLGIYTGKPVYLVCGYLSKADETLLEEIREECIVTRWNSCGVDIIAKGGGKVVGIQRYLEANGITKEEIIAFGDGENDLEMLKFAGIGVAMGNAEEIVKCSADYVTDDVDEDGIAKALKYFNLI